MESIMIEVKDVVQAKRFELVDADEKVRVSIGLDENGNATMQFLDQNDKVRVRVGSEKNGQSSITLHDSDGEARVVSMVAENGSSFFFMYDKQGVTRVQVETGSADITTLIIGGKNKKPLVKASIDSHDGVYEQGNVSLYDSAGKLLAKTPQTF